MPFRKAALLSAVVIVALGGTADRVAGHTLAEAVRAALTTNPTARASDADVKAAALELLQLEEEFLPRVDFGLDAGASYYDDEARLDPEDNQQTLFARGVELTAEYRIFDGYRRANRVYRNSARLDGAILRLLDASETLGLSAVQAYIDVVRHRNLLSVSNANVARHVEIKRQVDELVDGGRLPASAAFEVEERLLAARLARLEVQNALADADARFEAVVGLAPHGGFSVPELRGLPASRQETVSRAVANSFRVRSAATQVREREFERAVREGDRLPTVSLRAGVRSGWDQFGEAGYQSDALVGFSVDWELYAGGRKAETGALTERARQAMAQRDETVREVQEFAARSWNSYETGIDRVVLLNFQRQSAENVVTQYRDEFRAGTRTLIDVLDAERSLFNIRFEDVSARAGLQFAGYRILAAQSRLAEHFGIAPADMPLSPNFVERARSERPAGIFNTEIRALE